MKRSNDLLPTDEAVRRLCADDWAPSDVHVPSSQSELVLRSLLPLSRREEGRVAIGGAPGAIRNLTSVLRIPNISKETHGERAIRILRNLCVRSPENQNRTAECKSHEVVLSVLGDSLSSSDKPFYGFAVEFLVNFVTANPANSQSVWDVAYPTLFHHLLKSPNLAAAAASAALIHNCVAAVPQLLSRLIQHSDTELHIGHTHPSTTLPIHRNDLAGMSNTEFQVRNAYENGDEHPPTLLHTLIAITEDERNDESADEYDEKSDSDDRFWWAFLIIRRLISGGMVRSCFEALGPPLNSPNNTNIGSPFNNNSNIIDSDSSASKFSTAQRTLLHLIDAGAGKTAEGGAIDMEFQVPNGSEGMIFFGDILDTAFLYRDAPIIRCTASIIASIIIMNDNSSALSDLRLRTVKIAIAVLQAISSLSRSSLPANHHSQPYHQDDVVGLKAAVVRAIAICCDECPDAQNLVLNLKGVPVVLNALAYEDDVQKNPFLREWAVLAVRNLTLRNQQVVDEINSLEFIGIRNEDWLERAGLEAFVDEKTGRPHLRQKNPKI